MVYAIIGLIHDITEVLALNHKEGLPMKTKAIIFSATCVNSLLLSVWTMGANLLAGALLA
jgi:hypothetical protein